MKQTQTQHTKQKTHISMKLNTKQKNTNQYENKGMFVFVSD